jgi:hypothetical protein
VRAAVEWQVCTSGRLHRGLLANLYLGKNGRLCGAAKAVCFASYAAADEARAARQVTCSYPLTVVPVERREIRRRERSTSRPAAAGQGSERSSRNLSLC